MPCTPQLHMHMHETDGQLPTCMHRLSSREKGCAQRHALTGLQTLSMQSCNI
jgi:hypothetical protein